MRAGPPVPHGMTHFAHYQTQLVARQPKLAASIVVPAAPVVLTGTELWILLHDAFEHGVVHHAEVTRTLMEMARIDAEQAAEAEAKGPAGLKPHFDQLFGKAKAG